MGKVIISNGSGGGVGSDDVTASRGDVLSGKTAVTTDSDDEASAGTMSNNAGWNARVVNDATKVSVPKGFHNGSGYVESWIAGLNPSAVMAGKTVGGVVGTATNDAVLDPNFLVVGYSGYDDGVKKNG